MMYQAEERVDCVKVMDHVEVIQHLARKHEDVQQMFDFGERRDYVAGTLRPQSPWLLQARAVYVPWRCLHVRTIRH